MLRVIQYFVSRKTSTSLAGLLAGENAMDASVTAFWKAAEKSRDMFSATQSFCSSGSTEREKSREHLSNKYFFLEAQRGKHPRMTL
jgi:hypothetical protein